MTHEHLKKHGHRPVRKNVDQRRVSYAVKKSLDTSQIKDDEKTYAVNSPSHLGLPG